MNITVITDVAPLGSRLLGNDGEARSPLLEVSGLTKRFGGLVAVKDIGLRSGPARSWA